MAFHRRVLPISKDVLDRLEQMFQQERALREQQVSQLQEQIDDLKRNTSVSDMPDYLNARVAWSLTEQGLSRVSIIKINAPCYFLTTSAGRYGDNQDSTITLGSKPTAWNGGNTDKLIGIQGVCSDTVAGGAFIAPIYPGTSTYAAAAWYNIQTIGTYIIIIPTISTTKYFDENGIPYSNLFTDTGHIQPYAVSANRTKIAIPGSNEWREIFQGDWRNNF